MRRWGVFAVGEVRTGLRRVRGSVVPLLQSAMAAGLAWFLAEQLLGRQAPLFAPIAAFVCLGFKVDRVPRKVAEMGVGATVGVLIGEVISLYLGAGWWQMALALISGAMIGRFLDRGELTTMQGGVNAMVVVGMTSYAAQSGGFTGRWMDAIVGALVAWWLRCCCLAIPRNAPAGMRAPPCRSSLNCSTCSVVASSSGTWRNSRTPANSARSSNR
jgi:hypothetical protein